mgnify:CR=1 FL=1
MVDLIADRIPGSMTGYLRGLWERLTQVAEGFVPIASVPAVYLRRGSLYSISYDAPSTSSGDTRDIVIRNPEGSGNVVSVMSWSASATTAGSSKGYRPATFTGSGETLTPKNYDTSASTDTDVDVEAGQDLIDPAGPDERFEGGINHSASGPGGRAVASSNFSGVESRIGEGGTFGIRFEADENGATPIFHIVIAEYEAGGYIPI